MQNWKIKRMSYRRIHAWIIAINKLLAYYEGKIKYIPCPLCDVMPSGRCNSCLWEIIEGEDCRDFAQKLPFCPRDSWGYIFWHKLRRYKRYRVLRIPMLKNWKKTLKMELARREL